MSHKEQTTTGQFCLSTTEDRRSIVLPELPKDLQESIDAHCATIAYLNRFNQLSKWKNQAEQPEITVYEKLQ